MCFAVLLKSTTSVHFDTSSSSLVNEITTAVKVYAYGVEDYLNDPTNSRRSLLTQLSCEAQGAERWDTGDSFFRYLKNVSVEAEQGRPNLEFTQDGVLKAAELKIMNLRPGLSRQLVWEEYQKKSDRQTPKQEMQEAVNRLPNNNESIRSVARDKNIFHVTLTRYVRQAKQNNGNQISLKKYGNSKHKQVFTEAQHEELVKYIMHSSKINFGLSPREVRKLANECATAFNIKVPESWEKNKDWLTIFLKTH
ncbi:hypothetical protein NQ317_019173 [Molorchus minor]|uniref:HTH CENPB-type domain-containing protein n=1 Tax=Molorchus minor TaxID=1323400 RepID=A0ABQ9IVN1_9CUCU|nr:hypothetical protein NQ317_019173 [Molorchus minor]